MSLDRKPFIRGLKNITKNAVLNNVGSKSLLELNTHQRAYKNLLNGAYKGGFVSEQELDDLSERVALNQADENYKFLRPNAKGIDAFPGWGQTFKRAIQPYSEHDAYHPDCLAYAIEKEHISYKKAQKLPFEPGTNAIKFVRENWNYNLINDIKNELVGSEGKKAA